MVYRVYVEKKPGFALEADALLKDIRSFLRIESLKGLRLLNRYDVEGAQKDLFDRSVRTIFSEAQLDNATADYPHDGDFVFAVEYLPGQYDQRADSAAQCVQLLLRKQRPQIATATIYALFGELTAQDVEKIKKYVINPVDSREASMEKPHSLAMQLSVPESVPVVEGFLPWSDEESAAYCR